MRKLFILEKGTLVEVNKRYFWHNKIKDVRSVVRTCKQGQIYQTKHKRTQKHTCLGSIYKVALNTTWLLPETLRYIDTS